MNHHSTGQALNFTGGISGAELTDHYINLVCSDETIDQVLLDGNQVTFEPFPDNADLMYARIALNIGEHNFTAPEGVWAEGYSFGPYEACTFAFGHNIIVEPLTEIQLSAEPESSTDQYCSGVGILFGYATDLTIEDIAWDFDGLGISQDEAPVFLFEDTGSYEVSFTATSSDGCPISSTLIIEVVDCTNSIAQTIEDNVSVISMNGSTVIQSSFSSPLNCAILGMDGKQVAFAHGQSTIEMQHQGLASGIYILHIWSKQGTFNQKLWITE